MKWIARTSVALVVLVLAAVGLAMVNMVRSLPRLDGQLSLPGLSAQVQVSRDSADVLHIQAARSPTAHREAETAKAHRG